MYGLIRNPSCFLTNQILIEVQDQFKIMLAQTVLTVILKCCCKENMLFLNIGKLLYQSIINSFSHSHMLKGFRQKLIEIPVDKVKFVHKIPIESLPRNTTILCDLFYCDVIYRHRFHTFLHRPRKTVFHFFTLAVFCRQLHKISSR